MNKLRRWFQNLFAKQTPPRPLPPLPSSRPVLQKRPLDSAAALDRRQYGPNRDLAWNGIKLLQKTMDLIRQEDGVELAWLCQALGVPEGTDIGLALCRFVNEVNNPECRDVEHAYLRSGLKAEPRSAQLVFYARLGELVLGKIFVAMRDVTPLGGELPPAMGVDAMVAEAMKLPQKARAGAPN